MIVLLDTDVLVDEIAGTIEGRPVVDPQEERRARIRAAADSLDLAVEGLVSGSGDAAELAGRVRDESGHLRDEKDPPK